MNILRSVIRKNRMDRMSNPEERNFAKFLKSRRKECNNHLNQPKEAILNKIGRNCKYTVSSLQDNHEMLGNIHQKMHYNWMETDFSLTEDKEGNRYNSLKTTSQNITITKMSNIDNYYQLKN